MTQNRHKTLDEHENRLFAAWCAAALMKMPYMAPLLYTLRPVSTTATPYAAVDNHGRLYINFDGVARHGSRFGSEVLLHECSHILADHFTIAATIRGAEGTETWGRAADLAINDDLVAAGCDTIAEIGITPATYGLPEWKTPHWYYDALAKAQHQNGATPKPTPQAAPQPEDHTGSQDDQQTSATSTDPSQGQNNNDANHPPSQDPNSRTTTSGSGTPTKPGTRAGSRAGSRWGTGDDDSCGSGSGGAPIPDELGPDHDLDGTAPAADPVDITLARQATAQAIIDHNKSRGTVPAGLLRQAEEVLAPEPLPWWRILGSHANRHVVRWRTGGARTDWSRRSRRHHNATMRMADGTRRRVYVPARREPIPSLAVIIDSSGSVPDHDLGVAYAHIDTVSRQLGIRGPQLRILDVDARVGRISNYVRTADPRTVVGGGGTDMRVGIETMWELPPHQQPAVIIVLTDGYTPWPDLPGPVPVIAGILARHGTETGPMAAVPNFITAVHVPTTTS